MNLLNRFGLGKGDDEDDNLAKDTTPASGPATPELGQEGSISGYDDSLAKLGIAAETVLSDDLLTSGQAKKVRFDYPSNAKAGYSARQVDEFMSGFLVPTLDWHEQALHKRDLDVYRLGQELDSRESDLQKARFGAQVADSVARVDEDKEFKVLMTQLEEAEAVAKILREDNEAVRTQYEELYPQYIELWERYNGELDEEPEFEQASSVEAEQGTEEVPVDDLLALDEPSTTALPIVMPAPAPVAPAVETVDDIPAELVQELVEPYEERLAELTAERERLTAEQETTATALAQAEALVADLRAALEEAQNAPDTIPEGYYDEAYVLAITAQYNDLSEMYAELVRRIEDGEYSTPAEENLDGEEEDVDAEDIVPVEWAARMEELEGEAVSRNEELALAHAQIADLEAQLQAAREGRDGNQTPEWEEEDEPEQAPTHDLKPEELPPGIRLEDL